MKSFENIEIALVRPPACKEVLARLRRHAACRGDPSSVYCTYVQGRDDYLLRDEPASRVCQRCPAFEEACNNLMADWEEWVLAQQEAFA